MKDVLIYEKDITYDNVNSLLFADYIYSCGFRPENYNTILETAGSVKQSMSQFLNTYNQFLLSKRVKYDELLELGIKGANGYLTDNGIVILDDFGKCPNFSDDDVIIANGTFSNMDKLVSFEQDKYIGFCMDSDDNELLLAYKKYKSLLELLNRHNPSSYVMEHDTVSNMDKSLFLIRKK